MLKNAVNAMKNIGKSRSRSASREKVLKDSAVQASPSSREAVQVVKAIAQPVVEQK
ncbi:Transcriptional regulator [Caenorhabditis elegans]|uniref:Transcriptional regulator n=1 Tax=Caenorhabditis elegans TaxID=6239 RepID=G0KFF5_CAEEL|nr:Transcriptional regulator [Caenorhabditis elegans]CCC42157.1 Transcriptional regulator [Caenorhabditis elegans]|eukprot:NP_001254343.1 Uncharacterized protein CELE_C44C11.6 [Caenorhabditis elegans]